ncbi:MAG: PDZ domain-containing protein [Rhodospirillales bacterium]
MAEQGLDNYSLSADGKKVLIKQEKDWIVTDAAASDGGKDGDKKTLKLDDMRLRVDPRAVWNEVFDNGWRLERDFFYSTVMNGFNWNEIHDTYRKLLPLAGSREDVNYLIGQVIGELANSHTYVGGGDDGDPTEAERTPVLGADFALDAASGHYKFAKIYPGDNTRADYRSPLTEPGIGVREGDLLVAVNGTELRAPETPYSAMVGITPDETVTLTVTDSSGGRRRDVVVKPLKGELSVRKRSGSTTTARR